MGSRGGVRLMEIGGQVVLKGEGNKAKTEEAERFKKRLQKKGWRRFDKRESNDDKGGLKAARDG